MSCQQVSRLIPTTATPVTSEDPYVFTETVPTTPPILFNTQKSRTRVTDTQLGIAPATNITTPTTNTTPTNATAKLKHNQKSPLAHLNSHHNNNNNNNNTNNNNYNSNFNNNNNATKTQASLAAANVANNISNSATKVAPAPPILKHTTQSQNQQQQHQQPQNHQSKKALNVCIVRPQLQQQQPSPPQQPQQQQKLLQSRKQALSPPPLLQHTPSLWQTPLLLDTTSAVVSPPTSPASLPSPTGAPTPVTCAASAGAAMATTATLVNCTGAATALVTPLMSTSAAPLPPSKFHHTTLAQHLQKVQCIKKPKKPAVAVVSNGVVGRQQQQQPQLMQNGKQSDVEAKALTALKSAPIPPSPAVARAPPPPPPPPLQAFDAPQHSDPDLNEIPVNVIFRKPRADQPPVQAADTLKKHNTPIAAATPVVSKLKNVKIITPTLKATPQPQTPVQTQPLSPPALAPASVHNNFTPAPNAMRDILFVHPNVNKTAPAHPPKRDTSSKANELQQPAIVGTSCTPPTQKPTPVKVAKLGKGSPPAGANFVPPLKATTTPKTAYKRKASAPVFAAAKGQTVTLPFAQKRGRKLTNIFSVSDRHLPQMSTIGSGSCRAVAVVKLSAAEVDADTRQLASATVLPYCTQQHWLSIYADVAAKKRSCSRSFSPPVRNTGVSCFIAALAPNSSREDRITAHKTLLRRQALQLLATRSLQKLPLQAARRRLLCVDRLLRKYQQHTEDDFPPAKKCAVHACTNKVLELASHCQVHIASNATQHIFLPCSAKCADNTQCRLPVFDITHDLPLCVAHARKRTVLQPSNQTQQKAVVLPMFDYEDESQRQQQLRQQYHQQKQDQHVARMQIYHNMNSTGSSTTDNFNHNNGKKLVAPRKRKTISMNSVGRPQKRTKKAASISSTTAPQTIVTSLASAPPTQLSSAVLQRKSSTTSLESIASNSQSSNSLPHYTPSTLALPALAPLSNGSNAMDVGVSANASQRMLNFGASTDMHSNGVESELRAHEINQIVTQFVVKNNDNNSINNNNNNSCENSYHSNSSNNNSSHNQHMHFMHHRNSDSNFTSALGSTSSLHTTEDLLKQELLSVCENSSAYASSEDTGLGGLSETELMAGAHDADDIPLVDSGLLEEHDLANALSSLPEDAFNELFTAVHQEERDEVERALELADKHLKSLQQTIGIDFLGDFADVHDGILADTDMCSKMGIISSSMHSSMLHSPDTSGIDTSTLFIDSGSNSAGAGSTGATGSCPAVVDIRGLVQT